MPVEKALKRAAADNATLESPKAHSSRLVRGKPQSAPKGTRGVLSAEQASAIATTRARKSLLKLLRHEAPKTVGRTSLRLIPAPRRARADVCVLCQCSDSTPLWRVAGFDVVRCGCGLVRTVLPADYDPKSIYTDAYFQGGHSDGYADYQGSRDTLQREFARTVEALSDHGVKGGRLLEVGCAYGYFLDEARKRFDVCGVEVAPGARAACRERGLDVVERITPKLVADHGPFDVVVMLDVIEHLDDPGAVLATIRRAMRPGGRILITTGDAGALSARLFGSRWRLMTPPQHLWFFSRPTLRALLARHGFTVESATHPWKLVPLQLVAYQASRAIGAQGLLKGRHVPGSLPINLFDAMRVIARRD